MKASKYDKLKNLFVDKGQLRQTYTHIAYASFEPEIYCLVAKDPNKQTKHALSMLFRSLVVAEGLSGDLVPLLIGDQVPTNGILILGHSLAVDESSLIGKPHKDLKTPFLMARCKVADSYGIMLVTVVGINIEWGLLMASISEGNAALERCCYFNLHNRALCCCVVSCCPYGQIPDGSVQFVKGHTSVKDAIDGAVKILTGAVYIHIKDLDLVILVTNQHVNYKYVTIVVVDMPEALPLAVTLTSSSSWFSRNPDELYFKMISSRVIDRVYKPKLHLFWRKWIRNIFYITVKFDNFGLIEHKDLKTPFLMPGCKVFDDYEIMLNSSVGIIRHL
ncbi:hypothetical protein IEQ34_008829 [Dendrobium chrysotoxum]|uniref:Uncharacterized protein n=1 Tax=Dendrobium chrysotoxum TaxID=161865 RepID=A0AAV7H0L8_DENCH|nr:hypothetical protein IEQ34_008829 [Dendrobium chrysotoxum]